MLYQLPLADRYQQLSDDELRAGIRRLKEQFGKRLVILGHHYQQQDVIEFADLRGDSLKLSQLAAEQKDAEFIVFCGVHFMAESADILTDNRRRVILPDLSAGCSMADMADIDDVEDAWQFLEGAEDGTPITPITYVNSSAAVKAFVGRHDGACCTSSNAKLVVEWALHGGTPNGDGGHKILFAPDQHLGRNTAYALGFPLGSMIIYDPAQRNGGLTAEQVRAARFILWKGHCSVHGLFTKAQIDAVRKLDEPYNVIVHPECAWEVCQAADLVGSTEYIIQAVNKAPAGSYWAIGTEHNLVKRVALENPDKHVRSLAGIHCLCTTMYRIDLRHLYWCLERLAAGEIANQVSVDTETRHWSKVALDRMLALRPTQPISAK